MYLVDTLKHFLPHDSHEEGIEARQAAGGVARAHLGLQHLG
jgi:hypothetical protein